MLIYSLISQIY